MFKLSSEITGRQPIKKINRTVQQYESDSVQLNITNPLLKTGNFLIKLITTINKISVDDFLSAQKGMLHVMFEKKNVTYTINARSYVRSVCTLNKYTYK